MQRLRELFHTLCIKHKRGWIRPWSTGGSKLLDTAAIPLELREELSALLQELELTQQEKRFVHAMLQGDTTRMVLSRYSKEQQDTYEGYELSLGYPLPGRLFAYERLDILFDTELSTSGDETLKRFGLFLSSYSSYIHNEFTMLRPEVTAPMHALLTTLRKQISLR